MIVSSNPITKLDKIYHIKLCDYYYSTLSIFSALKLRSILYLVGIRLNPLRNRLSQTHEMTLLIS